MGKEFKEVLLNNHIKHEQSAPYSPHQRWVGVWLLNQHYQKPYAIMAAAYVGNRCYQQCTQQTPFFLITGHKPNINNINPFRFLLVFIWTS